MLLTGSQIVAECLIEQGVDTVFGYPGGTILNIYDALYQYQDKIHHILTSHEQGAAHAADGYARSTGKVGVCMATSGPGATNLVTGIATAYMDSTPLLLMLQYRCLGVTASKKLISLELLCQLLNIILLLKILKIWHQRSVKPFILRAKVVLGRY